MIKTITGEDTKGLFYYIAVCCPNSTVVEQFKYRNPMLANQKYIDCKAKYSDGKKAVNLVDFTQQSTPVMQQAPTMKSVVKENTLPFVSESLRNEILCTDTYLKEKKSDIVRFYAEHNNPDERAVHLHEIYNDDFTELIVLDNHHVGYKRHDKGLHIWEGSFLSRIAENFISWNILQAYIGNLITKKIYTASTPAKKSAKQKHIDTKKDNTSKQLSLFDHKNPTIQTSCEETVKEIADESITETVNIQPEIIEELIPVQEITHEKIIKDIPSPDPNHCVNFHQTTISEEQTFSPKEKYKQNIAAIKKLIEIENRSSYATPEEQVVLSKYSGWGGLADVFDETKTSWTAEYQELKSLLSQKEYADARASVLNAHYTSPTIIKYIYKALEKFGFHTGNILEPAMGIGNFFSLLPKSMEKSKLYGVELDSISGRIAKQLYPLADIQICGFEETNFPNNFFDVAIGNVPFGDYKVNDPAYNANNFLIHDYFFGATRF